MPDICLRSLGGVFIATLVGLGIALIVLVFEVYNNKKEAAKDEVKDFKSGRTGNSLMDGTSPPNTGDKRHQITVGGKVLNVKSKDLFMTRLD